MRKIFLRIDNIYMKNTLKSIYLIYNTEPRILLLTNKHHFSKIINCCMLHVYYIIFMVICSKLTQLAVNYFSLK